LNIAGGTSSSQWEDITGSAVLNLVEDCASFSTTVSARLVVSVHWHSVVLLHYGTGTFGHALHLAEHLLVVCGSSYVVHAVLEWIVSWYYCWSSTASENSHFSQSSISCHCCHL